MKIAVITTQFLEEYVRYALTKLRSRCDVEILIYRDFQHVGDLYLELEDQFDGFLVSGPVPRVAILKRVGTVKKPIESFGTDAQCYYEVFFRALYEQKDPDLSHGYFDLLEWADTPQPLATYLAAGTFGKLLDQVYESTTLRSLPEIAELEKKVLEKHLSLWREGRIQYSVTRFSSIMLKLQEAGIKTYFVYPHLELIRAALDTLMKDIDLNRMYGNQLAILRLSLREEGLSQEASSREDASRRLDKLERVLSDYNQEHFCGFVIQRGDQGVTVFSQLKEIRRITEEFQSCTLKPYLQKRCGFPVCIGYGLGSDVSHAMVNALGANREAAADPMGSSFLRNERNESIGPLRESRTAEAPTSQARALAAQVSLSTATVQRLLDALGQLATDQVTSQSLATALGVTARSANRLLNNLVKCGVAQVLYGKQTYAKGRPERVYQIHLSDRTK